MADTQLKALCLFCESEIAEGPAVFIGCVNLTSTLLSGATKKRQLAQDHLRVRHRASAQPRGLAHRLCFIEATGIEDAEDY